jgi:hypothetical protein
LDDGYEPVPDDGGIHRWLRKVAAGEVHDENLPDGMECPCPNCLRERNQRARVPTRVGLADPGRHRRALTLIRERRT